MTHLSMWTVYDHPLDYPDSFVARCFHVDSRGPRPSASIIIAPTLELLRETLEIHMHLTCLTRNEGDDPKIVETWL